MMTVIDCSTRKLATFDLDAEIAARLASGLRFAVYRNGERYTDCPLTEDDCQYWATSWQFGSSSSVYTVAEWTD